MPYRIEFLPAAARQLKKLDRPVQLAAATLIDELAEDPRPEGVKKLGGVDDVWRVKFRGSFRMAYRIHDDRLEILVIAVADRKEIYEIVKRVLG